MCILFLLCPVAVPCGQPDTQHLPDVCGCKASAGGLGRAVPPIPTGFAPSSLYRFPQLVRDFKASGRLDKQPDFSVDDRILAAVGYKV